MLRTASSLPLRAFDAGLRPRPFPDEAASLLPGLLAATRTGLPPASDDELTNIQISRYVTASPPVLLGAQDGLTGCMKPGVHAPGGTPAQRLSAAGPPHARCQVQANLRKIRSCLVTCG